MINVIFSETTKNLTVKNEEKNIDKIIEKNNYSLFFSNNQLCGYLIKKYGEKNTGLYNNKLTGLLNKDILELVK